MSATAVLDVGATNSKLLLFDDKGRVLHRASVESSKFEGPPYLAVDPEPILDFAKEQLRDLGQDMAIDRVVVSAHGSALALLDEDDDLALPILYYEALPPEEVVRGYAEVTPPFNEVYAPTNPMALTLGLQLYWQQHSFPEAFARVRTILPYGQYLSFRLGGRPVSEVTALGAQTHLWDVKGRGPSSLTRKFGWDRLLAPLAPAWEVIGVLPAEVRGTGFKGRGELCAGIHDSNANYLRYLASGLRDFTLLSSGTWIIGFDTATDPDDLDPARDTATNSDVFGRPVACCRFMGGREFAILADGAPTEAARLDDLLALIARGTTALPSFTDSGGPLPGSGGRGRVLGPPAETDQQRVALAVLYTALMTSESLDAVGSRHKVVIDGPFALNPLYLAVLAALRPEQQVLRSNLRDGTAAGAALLGAFEKGQPPRLPLDLKAIKPRPIAGLSDYAERWRGFVRQRYS